jgi:hypothetical protein
VYFALSREHLEQRKKTRKISKMHKIAVFYAVSMLHLAFAAVPNRPPYEGLSPTQAAPAAVKTGKPTADANAEFSLFQYCVKQVPLTGHFASRLVAC